MREAPSRVILSELLKRGATVTAHDPVAMDEARRVLTEVDGLRDGIAFADSPEAALAGADALLVVTEWKAFRSPDFDGMKAQLKRPLVIDGRNLYEPALMKQLGFEHVAVGRPQA
jgi:UDPglucose 6-dehydrogenase